MPDEDVTEVQDQEVLTEDQGESQDGEEGQTSESQDKGTDEGDKEGKPSDVDYWRSQYHKKQRQYNDLKQRYGGMPQRPTSVGRTEDDFLNKPIEELTDVKQFYQRVVADAKRAAAQDFSETQKNDRLSTTQEQARSSHDGKDGLPEYDTLVDEMVVPMIERNPNVYYLLREMPNPAEAAYTLGLVMKYPDLSKRLRAQGREDLAEKIDETTKKAVTLKGRKDTQTSPKQTKEDLIAMKPDDFEKEIAKITGRR